MKYDIRCKDTIVGSTYHMETYDEANPFGATSDSVVTILEFKGTPRTECYFECVYRNQDGTIGVERNPLARVFAAM